MPDKRYPRRILAMRFSALGDVAMTLPLIYSLARQYPDVHIDFITAPFFARLFINAPANITVHPIDLKKDYKGVPGLIRLFRRLKDLNPEAVADLHNVGRTWMLDTLFRLNGVKIVMVDKMRSGRKKVLRGGNAQPPFIKRYADVFEKLGLPVRPDFRSLELASGDNARSVKKPAAGIAPFARYMNKAYPIDMIKEVAKQLSQKGVNVYFFGGRGEEAQQLETLAEGIENVFSLAGKYPIEEELSLMKEMDVMLTMDSANHHLASLAGTQAISLWGSTTPSCGFMAYGQPSENAIVVGVPCQPCTIAGSNRCKRGDLACFRNISPERVTQKMLSHIELPE